MNRFRFTLLGLVLVVTAVLVADRGYCETGEMKPRAVFPESRFTFDMVMEGAKVEHDFVVRNTGNATLKILKTDSG